jgi:hypothetical protein
LRYLGMVDFDHSAPYAKRSMSSLLLPTVSCFQKLAAAATIWPIRAYLVNIRANLLPPLVRALP